MEIVLICLALGVGVVVAGIIAFFGRCKVCGSMNHAFSQDHAANLSEGKAYIVCKRCGDRQYKGDVSADGSVIWMSGETGQFHEDGSYTSDSGTYGGGGGGE